MGRIRYLYHRDYDFGRGIPFVKKVHGFVLNKPAQIRDQLLQIGAASDDDFEAPVPLQESALSEVHTARVLDGLRSAKSIAEAGEFPPLRYVPSFVARHMLVTPQVRACAGTALALQYAAQGDWVFNLSGGFHHARPSLSHGFCLVNDVAWAIHRLRSSGESKRILILDLDLHQGDGNAVFFADDPDVCTASLHQESAFPHPKAKSDLDVGLHGAVEDREYLDALDSLLEAISLRFEPEVVVYVAGTDPYFDDAIGSFELSAEGLCARDMRVAEFAKKLGVGLVALPAGGYCAHSPSLSAEGFAAMARVHP